MQNVVYASFGTSRENMWKARTRPLWQYDYGQILKITGVTLPSNYEVHFSNEKEGGTAKTVLGNANGVAIPDEYLTTGRPIYAWIFLHAGSGDGETVYTIHIPVRRRSESTDTALTPTEKSVVSQAVEALNTAAENAAEAVAADLVDDTLSVTGKAADAAKTGEELSNLKSDLMTVDDKIDDIAEVTTDITETTTRTDFSPTWEMGVCKLDGSVTSSVYHVSSTGTEISVQQGDVITCGDSRDVSKATMHYVTCYNGSTALADKGATDTDEFTVPYGVTKVVVTTASGALTNSYYVKRYRTAVTYSAKDPLAQYEGEEMHVWEG